MTSQKKIDQLQLLSVELSELITNAGNVYQTAAIRLETLERMGIIHARGYWRKNKYLSLYFPSHKGRRRMAQYVGCNPKKIVAAESAMQRAIEYEEVLTSIARMESVAEQCCFVLASLTSNLKSATTQK